MTQHLCYLWSPLLEDGGHTACGCNGCTCPPCWPLTCRSSGVESKRKRTVKILFCVRKYVSKIQTHSWVSHHEVDRTTNFLVLHFISFHTVPKHENIYFFSHYFAILWHKFTGLLCSTKSQFTCNPVISQQVLWLMWQMRSPSLSRFPALSSPAGCTENTVRGSY